jgi:hypothetical protein
LVWAGATAAGAPGVVGGVVVGAPAGVWPAGWVERAGPVAGALSTPGVPGVAWLVAGVAVSPVCVGTTW